MPNRKASFSADQCHCSRAMTCSSHVFCRRRAARTRQRTRSRRRPAERESRREHFDSRNAMRPRPALGSQPKRKVSAAARRRMARAQKARWAKSRNGSPSSRAGKAYGAARVKRTLSPAARRKIAAAQRARWAQFGPSGRKRPLRTKKEAINQQCRRLPGGFVCVWGFLPSVGSMSEMAMLRQLFVIEDRGHYLSEHQSLSNVRVISETEESPPSAATVFVFASFDPAVRQGVVA